jgi:hypothetical protein
MSIFPDASQDAAAKQHGETDFAHLSRRAGPDWERVRGVIDEWCNDLDVAEWSGTLGHLKSGQSREFRSALWELYLGAVFRRLGFTIEHHGPARPGKRTPPDFRLRRGSTTIYVEATSIDEEGEVLEAQRRLGALLDAINGDDRISRSSFLLDYDAIHTSDRMSPLRSLCDQITEWLAHLPPTSVSRIWLPQYEECQKDQGCFEWRHGGWWLRFFAIPRRPEARGVPLDRVIGWANPGDAWLRRDALDIKEALERKARKYGDAYQTYVIAIMSPRTTEEHEIKSALLGIAHEHPSMIRNARIERGWSGNASTPMRREVRGFWLDQNGPRNRNVAAVITAVGLQPYNMANVELDLWFNPWADHPLGDEFPFRAHRADMTTGSIVPSAEPVRPARSILGLWEGWPRVAGEESNPGLSR